MISEEMQDLFSRFLVLQTPDSRRVFLELHPEFANAAMDSFLESFEESAETRGDLTGLAVARQVRALLANCQEIGTERAVRQYSEDADLSPEQGEHVESAFEAIGTHIETENAVDLDAAIEGSDLVCRELKREISQVHIRQFFLRNLVLLLNRRYKIRRDDRDRDYAIESLRELRKLNHRNDPNRILDLLTLGIDLEDRFVRQGAFNDAAEFPEDVLSQMGMFIVHRLINDRDRQIVENACGSLDASAAAFLPILGQGEALVIGLDTPMTMPVQILWPEDQPDSTDIDLW